MKNKESKNYCQLDMMWSTKFVYKSNKMKVEVWATSYNVRCPIKKTPAMLYPYNPLLLKEIYITRHAEKNIYIYMLYNMLYHCIFLQSKKMLIISYVEKDLWLTDDLSYLNIKFYKNVKYFHSCILCNKKSFANISIFELNFRLKLLNSTTLFSN